MVSTPPLVHLLKNWPRHTNGPKVVRDCIDLLFSLIWRCSFGNSAMLFALDDLLAVLDLLSSAALQNAMQDHYATECHSWKDSWYIYRGRKEPGDHRG